MRTFIALELSQEIRTSVSLLQQTLQKTDPDVKWVEPQNIHLTLKFLGEIEDTKIKHTSDILEGIAKTNSSYSIRLSELGGFPKIDCPRVIWVGIDFGDSQTKEIARLLEEKLYSIGIPKETREFSTHITIGRVRTGKNRLKLVSELKKLSADFSGKGLEMQVLKITLFESKLSPKGPAYAPIKEVNLKTT